MHLEKILVWCEEVDELSDDMWSWLQPTSDTYGVGGMNGT